jgi:hypothetical protein
MVKDVAKSDLARTESYSNVAAEYLSVGASVPRWISLLFA